MPLVGYLGECISSETLQLSDKDISFLRGILFDTAGLIHHTPVISPQLVQRCILRCRGNTGFCFGPPQWCTFKMKLLGTAAVFSRQSGTVQFRGGQGSMLMMCRFSLYWSHITSGSIILRQPPEFKHFLHKLCFCDCSHSPPPPTLCNSSETQKWK